ncbi:MAG: YtxH domain-containing protein [Acidimicrobiia bacterium]|nr:YtxH domain-containing protein [Acidimicrobiia bacterium]
MVLLRILFFPVKLLLSLLGFTLKVGYKTTTMPIRLTAKATGWVGFKAFVCFALGAAVGLLLAPVAGTELRNRIRRMIEGSQPPTDDELADKVGFELSRSATDLAPPSTRGGGRVRTGRAGRQRAPRDRARGARARRGGRARRLDGGEPTGRRDRRR